MNLSEQSYGALKKDEDLHSYDCITVERIIDGTDSEHKKALKKKVMAL